MKVDDPVSVPSEAMTLRAMVPAEPAAAAFEKVEVEGVKTM